MKLLHCNDVHDNLQISFTHDQIACDMHQINSMSQQWNMQPNICGNLLKDNYQRLYQMQNSSQQRNGESLPRSKTNCQEVGNHQWQT